LTRLNRLDFPASPRTQHNKTVLLAGLLLMVFWWVGPLLPMAGAAQTGTRPAPGPVESKRIEGRWVRPDGGYILQVQDVKEDGSLVAAYFNPRPIHVARAETRCKEGAITLFVELRDVNYPGSTYTMAYDPATDRLKGTYFQAAMQQTFEVEFVRIE